jgi:hypothetical protein
MVRAPPALRPAPGEGAAITSALRDAIPPSQTIMARHSHANFHARAPWPACKPENPVLSKKICIFPILICLSRPSHTTSALFPLKSLTANHASALCSLTSTACADSAPTGHPALSSEIQVLQSFTFLVHPSPTTHPLFPRKSSGANSSFFCHASPHRTGRRQCGNLLSSLWQATLVPPFLCLTSHLDRSLPPRRVTFLHRAQSPNKSPNNPPNKSPNNPHRKSLDIHLCEPPAIDFIHISFTPRFFRAASTSHSEAPASRSSQQQLAGTFALHCFRSALSHML